VADLTELEACSLGLLWRRQPCSAYVVKEEFLKSLTPEWSGSAGAIYPVIERLLARELIEAEVSPWGQRGKKLLRLTSPGRLALRQWVEQLGEVAGRTTADPVRTRMFFIDAVAKSARRPLLEESTEAARVRLESVRRLSSETPEGNYIDLIAIAGLIAVLEARIEWLEGAMEELEEFDQ
jgi:DNA-binding PadR family transcriptional regulator